MKRVILCSLIVAAVAWHSAPATIINVPGDYPTIQAGINAASHGDTVLVQPGTYNESVVLEGYGITVASMFILTGEYSYIDSTIIDGEGLPWGCVSFGAEWYFFRDAIIGFTIQNGELGVDCFHNTVPLISFNIITGNSQHGIWTEMTHPTIIHNVISGNSGDGIHYGLYTESEIYNNVIAGNSIGIYILNGSPTITNTILWGNEGDEIYVEDGSPSFRYCDIEGGWAGEGNIDVDPLFRDADNGDFHLMSTECGDRHNSPCIDAGDPSIFDSILDCNWGLGTEISDMGAYGGEGIPTAILDENNPFIPSSFLLHQNYPNPFNATTVIRYSLPEAGFATVSIYNLLGQRVAALYEGNQEAGEHTITWDALDSPSGIYFARLEAAGQNKTIKIVLLK